MKLQGNVDSYKATWNISEMDKFKTNRALHLTQREHFSKGTDYNQVAKSHCRVRSSEGGHLTRGRSPRVCTLLGMCFKMQMAPHGEGPSVLCLGDFQYSDCNRGST